MAGLKDKSGPPRNMNAFKMELAGYSRTRVVALMLHSDPRGNPSDLLI